MIISNITGERFWCRATEEKILTAWSENIGRIIYNEHFKR